MSNTTPQVLSREFVKMRHESPPETDLLHRGAEALTAEAAATRLEAYERVSHAAAGPARAPVLYLSDEQLAALFAPRQLENLVYRPLRRSDVSNVCAS
jgi:hypothetical protein